MTDTTHPEHFEPTELVLIDALGRGLSHERAGKLIGRSSKTVQRNLKNPDFAAAVEQRRAQISDDMRARLDTVANRALEVVENCMDAESEYVRLAAARLALQRHLTYINALDVAERLNELERLAIHHDKRNSHDQ